MVTFITVIHVVLCFFLIVVVLLQSGKGADMGAAFGGASQTVFGATGAVSLLHKVTTVTAVMFMFTSLLLAWNSAREQAGGGGLDTGIFSKERQAAEEEAEATPAEDAAEDPAETDEAPAADVEAPADEAAGGEAAPADAPPTEEASPDDAAPVEEAAQEAPAEEQAESTD